MEQLTNIIVGVDLTQGDRFVSTELSPPNVEAVKRAMWLAKLNSARLKFFFALDVSPTTQRIIQETQGTHRIVLDEAHDVLQGLVSQAAAEGIEASYHVAFGKSWLELIHQVQQNHHDLVLAGTRHLGAVRGMLMGSTGMKLLRKCPCPVWITQPQAETQIQSVLVAHCLRPVGDIAMETGCALAKLQGSQLHVLHSLDFSERERVFQERGLLEPIHQHQELAEQHIHAQLAKHTFAHKPIVQVVAEPPAAALLNYISQHDIQLLVMGTIARTGIEGFVTGNTAERLLPQIPCSVLALKPPGFVSPVSLHS